MSKEDELLKRISNAVLRHQLATNTHARYLESIELRIRHTGVTTNNVQVDLPGYPNPWNMDWTLHWSKVEPSDEWGLVVVMMCHGQIGQRAPVTKAPYEVQALAVDAVPEFLEKLAESTEELMTASARPAKKARRR